MFRDASLRSSDKSNFIITHELEILFNLSPLQQRYVICSPYRTYTLYKLYIANEYLDAMDYLRSERYEIAIEEERQE